MGAAFSRNRSEVPPESASWVSIPWLPLERICHHLSNGNADRNLANLAMVSPHYYNGVMKYLRGQNIRPKIKEVRFERFLDGVMVTIVLFPSFFPFYDLTNLDKRRTTTNNSSYALQVKLSGAKDPVFEKVISLLSTEISIVKIRAKSNYSSCLSLCEQLLRSSIIHKLVITSLYLSDTTARLHCPALLDTSSLLFLLLPLPPPFLRSDYFLLGELPQGEAVGRLARLGSDRTFFK
ncbi:hypothetical protein PMAYCL1PPCAC_25590, partial [Pristionchus mayeri]